jgi:hypothetical protein
MSQEIEKKLDTIIKLLSAIARKLGVLFVDG